MVDGVNFAEACCVVALAISANGTKVPVGLWLGDTENTTIVTALLADLVGRGGPLVSIVSAAVPGRRRGVAMGVITSASGSAS